MITVHSCNTELVYYSRAPYRRSEDKFGRSNNNATEMLLRNYLLILLHSIILKTPIYTYGNLSYIKKISMGYQKYGEKRK